MSKPLITILTVNYNTSDFIELMALAFRKLTKNSYKLIVCDNGSKPEHLLKLVQLEQRDENVETIFRVQSAPGSAGHGEALDILVGMVDTPYFAVMDADATFLTKNWDEKLLAQFNDKVRAAGTPYEKSTDKWHDFPINFCALYESETFFKYDCTFAAGDFLNKPEEDQGYLVRKAYMDNGLAGWVLKASN